MTEKSGQKFIDILKMNNKKQKRPDYPDPECLIGKTKNGGDCRRNEIVYEIKCKQCEDSYIGETSRNGHARGIEHVQDSKSGSKKKQEESVLLRHRREKHEGENVQFEMKVMSSYQHSALSRQCGEAVRIKEIDPKRRINNKQEYHQPGDVEISYKKNEKEYQINKDKRINTEEESTNNKNTTEAVIEIESEETINQRKITEYFVQNIRKEVEHTKESNDIEDTNGKNNEEESISTQQWIQEARERRHQRLEGKENSEAKEMRNRFTCEECSFKTTSNTNLKLHQNSNHKKKEQKDRA